MGTLFLLTFNKLFAIIYSDLDFFYIYLQKKYNKNQTTIWKLFAKY